MHKHKRVILPYPLPILFPAGYGRTPQFTPRKITSGHSLNAPPGIAS